MDNLVFYYLFMKIKMIKFSNFICICVNSLFKIYVLIRFKEFNFLMFFEYIFNIIEKLNFDNLDFFLYLLKL